ncbi:MAG TPA: SDR family oxidoreductase [Jatrophihabitans sp.]|jgi:NAD(P)-dependent dehydrogenase (short-subunit alcohol dehydrogenase family)
MTLSPDTFAGRHYIVTGGGSGIGSATAALLTRLGASVTVLDLDISRVPESIAAVKVDACDEFAVREAVTSAATQAPLSGLVNSVGIEFVSDVVDTTLAAWERVIGTNLTSYHIVTSAVLPYLSDGAAIVNVASQLGLVGARRFAAYTASKSAVIGYSRSTALDLAPRGIRVNVVCPGAVDTPLLQRQFADGPGPQGSLEDLVGMHPIGRLGRPSEIAEPIAFLLSDAASFITASVVVADGGYVAQ